MKRVMFVTCLGIAIPHIADAGDIDRFISSRGIEGAPAVTLRPEGAAGPAARVETAPTMASPNSSTPPIVGIQSGAFKSAEGGSVATSTDASILTTKSSVTPVTTTTTDDGGCCFVPGTLVTLADGATCPIEAIRIGHQVLGADGVINTVTGIDTPILGVRRLFSINGGPPFITPEHPILTTDGWKSFNPPASAREDSGLPVTLLREGDRMMTPGGPLVLEQAEASDGDHGLMVYTLNTKGNRTFIANGIVVYAVGSYDV